MISKLYYLCIVSFIFIYLLLAAGCTSRSVTFIAESGPVANNDLPFGLELPNPALLSLRAAANGEEVIDGAAFDTEAIPANNVSVSGSNAVFAPDWSAQGGSTSDDLAYALYFFEQPESYGGREIVLQWATPPADTDLWLGISHWPQRAWTWTRPALSDPLLLSGTEPYWSFEDQLLILVVLTGTQAAELASIALTGDPPTAALVVSPDPATGEAPLTIDFDASSSSSSSSEIVDYEWDFDGDWLFNESDIGELGARGSATAQFTYEDPLTMDAAVRVTDSNGLCATAWASISPYIYEMNLDDLHTSGAVCSIVEIPELENPAFVYVHSDMGEGRLMIVRKSEAKAEGWGTPEELATDITMGTKPAVAIVDGNPAIAFGCWPEPEPLSVRYIRANDAQGTSWGSSVPVLDDWSGKKISLAVIGGVPAIATVQNQDFRDNLVFIPAQDAQGSSWAAPIVVEQGPDTLGHSGNEATLAEVAEYPAIAYQYYDGMQDPEYYAMKFVRATDALGSSWNTPVVVIDSSYTVEGHSIVELPHDISLMGSCQGSVNTMTWTCVGIDVYERDGILVNSLDAVGASWGEPQLFDNLPDPLRRPFPRGVSDATDVNVTTLGSTSFREQWHNTEDPKPITVSVYHAKIGGLSSVYLARSLDTYGGLCVETEFLLKKAPCESIMLLSFDIVSEIKPAEEEWMEVKFSYAIVTLICYTAEGAKVHRFKKLVYDEGHRIEDPYD